MMREARLRGPRGHEVFSPNFLSWVAEGRLPWWWLAGEFLHHTDGGGRHFVWRLGQPDPRKLGWTLGVWPD